MATKKLTITLETQQLEDIRKLVASGRADSVSAFVKHAVGVSLADVTGWGAVLALALEETGGPISRKEQAWADATLGLRPRRRHRRRAA